ncbi:polysaccharide lyase family 7 protein [Vibrio breoganii]|uniref:polysaccharide lyase family 7 protein n=1 Tax=Vibrio breoganii TaxID=553239 RepID=UPI000C83BFDC|nr:polysaccharide lyase family 7 protein [Vibrio breoganii]PMK21550.1 alginate lyase [Vibrio breoganii]PMK28711.1 alginate lyase [Vibrio breoganii]
MKHIYLKSLLATSVLLAVGCTSTPVPQFDNNKETGEALLTPVAITASSHDGNGPDRLFDQDLTTRWSAAGDGEWATLDYGSVQEFDAVQAAFSKGNERQSKFDIQVSVDGETWTTVLADQMSSGKAIGLERFQFEPAVKARYVKYVGHGNTKSGWNSVTELAAVNCNVNACPASHIITSDVVAAEAVMIAEMKAAEQAFKDSRKELRSGNFGAPAVYPCDTTVKCDTRSPLPAVTGLPATPLAGNAPSENFDMTHWYLSQPFDHDKNGKPDDVSEWNLANGYQHPEIFYTADDGGLVFKSYVKGVRTSKNTKYARTELREMMRRGDQSISTKGVNKNNWVFSSAPESDLKAAAGIDGVLEATLKIDHATTTGNANEVGRFIIGQIHDQNDEPIRLYYRKLPNQATGAVYFAHESQDATKEDFYPLVGDLTAEVGEDGIALGEKFSYRIEVKGNTMTVSLMREGHDDVVQVVDMSDSGYDVGGKYMYFKAGVYNQNISGDLDDYSQATFYQLDVSHDTYTAK